MTEFEVYCLLVALRNHFTKESYDFFKYQKKTKVSYDTYSGRKDTYLYQKLARKFQTEAELTDFMVANMVKDKTWITDMVVGTPVECDENYKKFLKYKESLTYEFQNEVDVLLSRVGKAQELFTVKAETYPPLLVEHMSGRITLPTLIILNDFVGFAEKFDKKFGADDVVWGKVAFRMRKLKPFLKYDKDRIKTILQQKLLQEP